MKANIKWLYSAIRRGDTFFLASNEISGTFEQELKYMYWMGYRKVGNYLVRQ